MSKADLIRRSIDEAGTLLMPGVFDALSARLAVRAGFEVIFISGYGVAAARLGLPDLGYLTGVEMAEAAHPVCDAAGEVPVLVDADTGYGNPLNVARTVRDLARAGAAGIFLEDQVWPKRCGHMRGKHVIDLDEQLAKLHAARDTVGDELFIVARTDARAPLGLEAAIERAQAFREAGADATFVEAPQSREELATIASQVDGRKVANMVEKGRTPLLSRDELAEIGFEMIVYPLSGLYAAARAMADTYGALATHGTTRDHLDALLPWEQFHEVIELDQHQALEDRYRGDR